MVNQRIEPTKWHNLDRFYIITTNELWPSKLGHSRSPGTRLKSLQCANWIPLGIYATFIFDDAVYAEQTIIAALDKSGTKMIREWYGIKADELVQIVRKVIQHEIL